MWKYIGFPNLELYVGGYNSSDSDVWCFKGTYTYINLIMYRPMAQEGGRETSRLQYAVCTSTGAIYRIHW